MHFRQSGIRAKKATYVPALVAITQTTIVGRHRRRITVREGARLQGLPDWYDFVDQANSASYKQLGNGVNVGAVYNVLRAQVLRDLDLLSEKSNSDWFGGPHGNYLVIETDGNYDVLDHLKSIGSYGKQISNLSMGINNLSLIDANEQIHTIYDKFNIKSPPDSCLGCKYENKCGGGYYPTRYNSKNNSLNNKSVYCDGLLSFFDLITSKLKNYGYKNL